MRRNYNITINVQVEVVNDYNNMIDHYYYTSFNEYKIFRFIDHKKIGIGLEKSFKNLDDIINKINKHNLTFYNKNKDKFKIYYDEIKL